MADPQQQPSSTPQPSSDQLLKALEKAHLSGNSDHARELAAWHNELYPREGGEQTEGPGLMERAAGALGSLVTDPAERSVEPLTAEQTRGAQRIADTGRRGQAPQPTPSQSAAPPFEARRESTPAPTPGAAGERSARLSPGVQARRADAPRQTEQAPPEIDAMTGAASPAQEDAPDFNMARGAGERVGELAGGLLTTIRTLAGMTDVPLGGQAWQGEADVGQEDAERLERAREDVARMADQASGLDLGYVPEHTWESVKEAFREDGALSGSAWGEVAMYGAEQGIKSIPDMVAVTLSLPGYVLARSGEIGETRAENKGKDRAELVDVLEAAPAALGSAILERIGARGITQAGAESVGKEALKRGVAAAAGRVGRAGAGSAGKEAGTEFVQEGIIEYVGERFGTDAAMSFAEAAERGLAGAVAGGVYGGAAGTAGAGAREATRPSPEAELGRAMQQEADALQPTDDGSRAAAESLAPENAQLQAQPQGTAVTGRKTMADLVREKLAERGITAPQAQGYEQTPTMAEPPAMELGIPQLQEAPDATQERQQPQGDQRERPQGAQGGQAAEAGRGDRDGQGREVEEEAVAEQAQAVPKRRNRPFDYTGFSGETRQARSYDEVGDYRVAKVRDGLFEVIDPEGQAVSQRAGRDGAVRAAQQMSAQPAGETETPAADVPGNWGRQAARATEADLVPPDTIQNQREASEGAFDTEGGITARASDDQVQEQAETLKKARMGKAAERKAIPRQRDKRDELLAQADDRMAKAQTLINLASRRRREEGGSAATAQAEMKAGNRAMDEARDLYRQAAEVDAFVQALEQREKRRQRMTGGRVRAGQQEAPQDGRAREAADGEGGGRRQPPRRQATVDEVAQERPARRRRSRRGGDTSAMFIGQRADTADTTSLANASRLLEEGADPEKVRRETGWFRGADGKWRFEIDDSEASYVPREDGTSGDSWTKRLDSVLDHPKLFEAYPEIRAIEVTSLPGGNSFFGNQGQFREEDGAILISSTLSADDQLNTLLHEIQHAIQASEGFAPGGSPSQFQGDVVTRSTETAFVRESYGNLSDALVGQGMRSEDIPPISDFIENEDAAFDTLEERMADAGITREPTELWTFESALGSSRRTLSPSQQYRSLAGEIEARNTQARREMTPEQRRDTSPEATADTPSDQAIVRWGDAAMESRSIEAQVERMESSRSPMVRGELLTGRSSPWLDRGDPESTTPPDDLSAMGVDQPMPNWQPTYQQRGVMPRRPESGEVEIGERTVKLKPEDQPTRREGIRVSVIDIIGPRLYQGKIQGKSKLGFYRRSNSEVRIANFDDVEVMAHEMAHFLDMHYTHNDRFTDAYEAPEFRGEVEALSYTSDPDLRGKEGFAEFVRLWLTQYEQARGNAPKFTAKFETVLARDKRLNRKMTRLQEEMHRWYQQGDLAQFYAITSGNQYTKAQQATLLLNQRPGELWRQHYIDKIHAAKVMERTLTGDIQDATQSAYKQLQLLNGIEGISQESFKHGAPVIGDDGNITFQGPSLKDVWSESLRKGPRVLREQELYFVARRARELKRQGRENLITDAKIAEGLALAKKNPHFEQAFEAYQQYRSNAMQFYVDSGYITEDAARAMLEKNKEYVPFHRAVESVAGEYVGAGGFQRLKGGTQNIKPVYDNMMMQEQRHLYAALKARALRQLYNDALKHQDGSLFLSKIAPDSKPVQTTIDQMTDKTARAMAEEGISIAQDGVIEGDGETVVDKESIQRYFEHNPEELMFWTFGHKPKTTETMVDSFIDGRGKRVWVEIQKENQLLVDMLDNMDYIALPPGAFGSAVKMAMRVKNFQTLTITSMAQFVGPNMVRDAQQAFMLSGGKFKPGWDTMKGLLGQFHALLSDDAAWHEMKAQGGPAAGRVRTFYHENWGLASDVAYAPRKPFYYPSQMLHTLLDVYMSIADSAEIATRLGFYMRQRKEGVSAREAAWQAREISTDFRKHGTYAPWVLLQRTVPFLGAYVQSVDRDIRALADNKGEMSLKNLVKTESGRLRLDDLKTRVWMAGALIISLTATLALLNEDEERYQGLTPDQKARFYHLFIGGRHYTIPKPHGFISLVAQGAEAAMDVMTGQAGKDSAEVMKFATAYHFGSDAMPGIVNPVAEVSLNRTFTGAPVVSTWAQDREARYQYDDRTPLVYVNVGRALNISPDKAHHLMRGYTGYLSDFVDELGDKLLWDNQEWGERPFARDFSEMMAKQFKPREVPYRTKWTTGYYDLRRRAATAQANLSFLRNTESLRDQGPLEDFSTDQVSGALLGINKAFSRIDSAFSDQDEVIAGIKYDPRLSAEEKESRIESYYEQKNRALKDFYQQASEALEEVESKLD